MFSLPRVPLLLLVLAQPALVACVTVNVPPPTTIVLVAAPAGPSAEAVQPVAPPETPFRPSHLWHFDEPSGATAFDAAGGENGTRAPGVEHVRGCAGHAAALGGNAQSLVDLGRAAGQFGKRDFTVSLWFRTTTKNYNNELLSNRANGSHGNFFNLRFARSKVVYELDEDTSGTNYVALESKPALNDGAWHHVAARRRGPHATLFVDGRRAAEGSTGGVTNIDNGHSLEVGASSVATEFGLYFQGAVDEVAIFDQALRDDEVASLAAGAMGCKPGAG